MANDFFVTFQSLNIEIFVSSERINSKLNGVLVFGKKQMLSE